MKVHWLEAVEDILFFACFCFLRGFFQGGSGVPYPGFNRELRVIASQRSAIALSC